MLLRVPPNHNNSCWVTSGLVGFFALGPTAWKALSKDKPSDSVNSSESLKARYIAARVGCAEFNLYMLKQTNAIPDVIHLEQQLHGRDPQLLHRYGLEMDDPNSIIDVLTDWFIPASRPPRTNKLAPLWTVVLPKPGTQCDIHACLSDYDRNWRDRVRGMTLVDDFSRLFAIDNYLAPLRRLARNPVKAAWNHHPKVQHDVLRQLIEHRNSRAEETMKQFCARIMAAYDTIFGDFVELPRHADALSDSQGCITAQGVVVQHHIMIDEFEADNTMAVRCVARFPDTPPRFVCLETQIPVAIHSRHLYIMCIRPGTSRPVPLHYCLTGVLCCQRNVHWYAYVRAIDDCHTFVRLDDMKTMAGLRVPWSVAAHDKLRALAIYIPAEHEKSYNMQTISQYLEMWQQLVAANKPSAIA